MKPWLLILVFLAIVPAASAGADQFAVTVCPATPYYMGVVYSSQVYLTSYSFNSSADITLNNWSLYGSNDGDNFVLFDNQTRINFTADTPQTFTIPCGYVFYKYYVITFDAGFAGCPVITIIFNTQLYPPTPQVSQNRNDGPLMFLLGATGLIPVALAFIEQRRRRKRGSYKKPQI